MAKTKRNKPRIVKSSHATSSELMAYKEEFSGPLPPPQILIQYEQACPGAADRIIALAENQAKHRQNLEAKVIGSNVHNERIGMYLAFALTIFVMAIGAYLIMNNKPIEGYIAFFAPGLFQAGNYIYHKYAEHQQVKTSKKQESSLD